MNQEHVLIGMKVATNSFNEAAISKYNLPTAFTKERKENIEATVTGQFSGTAGEVWLLDQTDEKGKAHLALYHNSEFSPAKKQHTEHMQTIVAAR